MLNDVHLVIMTIATKRQNKSKVQTRLSKGADTSVTHQNTQRSIETRYRHVY